MNRWWVGAVLIVASISRVSMADVAAHPEAVRPLLIGAHVPNGVPVQTEQGRDTTLEDTLARRPAVLIFHRGGWCPYCDMQLAELRLIEPQLRALGYRVVAITPDAPQTLRRTRARQPAEYELLSDQSSQLTQAFGIAFRVDLKKLGPAAANVRPVLPVPAVFIVDGAGIVRFQHVNPDYRVLVPKDLVLAAARASLPPAN